MAVAEALAIGRTETLQTAKRNRPVGTTYVRLMSQWLKQHGLHGISTQERYRALLCHENLAAISAWRDDLDETQRRGLNHPGTAWHAFRRATKAATPAPTQQQVAQRVAAARKGRAIFWPQGAPGDAGFTLDRPAGVGSSGATSGRA
jgi:hypothetical protein